MEGHGWGVEGCWGHKVGTKGRGLVSLAIIDLVDGSVHILG